MMSSNQNTQLRLKKVMAIKIVAVSLVGVAVFAAGCSKKNGVFGVDQYADIPSGAIPAELGASVCNWRTTQATSAARDRQVFYQADFVGDTAEIAPAALRQFTEQLQTAQTQDRVELFLEPSSNEFLDLQRQSALVSSAGQLGFTGEVSVQLAYPPALGLLGGEAERLGRGAIGGGTGQGGNFGRGGGFGGGPGAGQAGGIF